MKLVWYTCIHKNLQIDAPWQLDSKSRWKLRLRASSPIHTKNSQPFKARATLILRLPSASFFEGITSLLIYTVYNFTTNFNINHKYIII